MAHSWQQTKKQSRNWDKKLLRNQQRDIKVNDYYKKNGWHVKRIWEHEIKKDLDAVVDDLSNFIDKVVNVKIRMNNFDCIVMYKNDFMDNYVIKWWIVIT